MKKELVALTLLTSVVFSGCQKNPDITPSDTGESAPDTSVSTTETDATDHSAYPTGIPYEEYLDVNIINATDTPNEVYFKELRYNRCDDKNDDNSYYIDISREKIDYIVSYLETADVPDTFRYSGDEILSPEEYEGHTYLGRVEIAYYSYDKAGPNRSANAGKFFAVEIFDEFPEGYQEFIDTINEDCGEETIILGEPLEWSTDLYMKLSGFTDETVNDGSIEDFLELYPYDVYTLMNRLATGSGYYEHENGYREKKEHYLFEDEFIMSYWPFFRTLPREIQSVESTDAEYQKFAEDVAARFGLDKSTVKDAINGDYKYIDGLNITIYRTTENSTYPYEYEQEERGTYYLVEKVIYDGGDYVQDDIRTFFYSKDGKFIIMMNGSYIESYWEEELDCKYLMDFASTCGDLIATYG